MITRAEYTASIEVKLPRDVFVSVFSPGITFGDQIDTGTVTIFAKSGKNQNDANQKLYNLLGALSAEARS